MGISRSKINLKKICKAKPLVDNITRYHRINSTGKNYANIIVISKIILITRVIIKVKLAGLRYLWVSIKAKLLLQKILISKVIFFHFQLKIKTE